MDLIKKAKKSALALKSEVQGIISAPGQQPGSYNYQPSSSSYSQAPSQQYSYGQQHSQSYTPGQQQAQYTGGSHPPPNQYTPAPQYGQTQPPQQSHMPPQPQGQYQHGNVHNLIAPPWSPPANQQQSQSTGSFQPQYSPHENPTSPPLYQTPGQQYQQPVNSPPPQGHFQPPSHQMGSPPIQQFGQAQFTGASPPIPQPYSTPSSAQQGHQQASGQAGYFPQTHQPNQASNFMQNFHATQNQLHGPQNPPPIPTGRPQQPQSSQMPSYNQGSQTPPLPPRHDTFTHSQSQMQPPNQVPPPYSSVPPLQGRIISPQPQVSQQPQQQSYTQQQPYVGGFHQPPQSPSPITPSYSSPGPVEGQMRPPQQYASSPPQSQAQQQFIGSSQNPNQTAPPQSATSPQAQAPQQFTRPSQSPNQTVPPYSSPPPHGQAQQQFTRPSQSPNQIAPPYSAPPPQGQIQQQFSGPSQSPNQGAPPYSIPGQKVTSPTQAQPLQPNPNIASQTPTPSRFSPRPTQGHMPPPRQDSSSHPQQAQPLQQSNRPLSQTSSISPQSTGGQILPNQNIASSPLLHQHQNRQSSGSVPSQYSGPKLVQNQGQGPILAANAHSTTPPPQKTQSRPPSQTSQSSHKAPVPFQVQSQAQQAQNPPTEISSPPPSKDNLNFNQPIQSPSLQPAPLNTQSRLSQAQQPIRDAASPPPTQQPAHQYQTFNHQIESPSLKPAPLNPQASANRTQTPPRHATSPPPSNQYQAFSQTNTQGPSPDPLLQRPPPTTQGRVSPPPTTQGRISPPSQNSSEGQYKAFHRPAESPSLKPAPLYSQPQQPVAPRQEVVSPPVKEYQAFNQKAQSPVPTFTAFKPPTPKSEGHVSPLKANSPVPQSSPHVQSAAPIVSQAPYPHEDRPYQVSPQSQHSKPAYGNQNSVQMPAPHSGVVSPPPQSYSPHSRVVSPPPQSQSPHSGMVSPPPQSQTPYSGIVSPVSPTQKTHSFPPQVFELDSGDHVPSVPQGRPSFPSSRSGPIEFADGLISVEHEESNHEPVRNRPFNQPIVAQDQPFNYEQASQDTIQRAPKTKCVEFEPTLSDINQFYQLHPAIVSQYSISTRPGADFALCEYCYTTFIIPHPWLANLFQPRPTGPQADKLLPISFEKIARCGFAFPRMRQVILGQTIPQRNVQLFMEYARLDATLPSCSGEPQTGDYYGSKAVGSLVMCKSCFERYIKNTAFERNFGLIKMAPGQQWGCDVGDSGYVHRVLLTDLAKNPPHFEHFAYEASKRLAMPPCTGHKQPIAVSGPKSSNIFRSVQDNQGVFCSAHFYDIIAGTPAEQKFGYEIDIDDEQKEVLSCDLSFPFSQSAMKQAVKASNYQIWYLPIVASNTTQPCPSITGHDEGELPDLGNPLWYEFKDHSHIEICARCYGMEIIVSQAESLFLPIYRAQIPGRIRQCYLSQSQNATSTSFDPMAFENTTAWRGQYLRNTITYCRDAGGDFTLAIEAATKLSSLPPPCGSAYRAFTKPSGRKFLGHQAAHPQDPNDATVIICEECHAFSVKGTRLEGFLSNDLSSYAYSRNPEGVRCATWSKQCKLRLRDSCHSGDFAAYANYHRRREEVYARLWQGIREMDVLSGLFKARTGKNNRGAEMNVQMGGLRLDQHHAGSDTGNSSVELEKIVAGMGPPPQGSSDAGNMPGLNLVMWEMASKERLGTEIERRMEVLGALREEWDVIN